ncbi:MAG: hypothetical protein QOG18_1318, partial [Microbacteriaceae bacterium]|nr:hypothetical protein [Microbacteriaceae bacterium]
MPADADVPGEVPAERSEGGPERIVEQRGLWFEE